MSSLQLMEYRKNSYKAGLDLEEASWRRAEDLEEVRLSKREENLLNKRGGGEELLLLQSKKLFSDALQTHDDETGEMAVAKAGFEAIRIRCFVEHGCIEKLCGLLKYPDPKIVVCCLEGLRNILKVGVVDQRAGKNGGKNIYRFKIAECGGLDSIESLTDHDNPEDTAWFEAFKKALVIICTYFPFDEYCIPPDVNGSREWSYYAIESPSAYQSNPLEGFQRPVIREQRRSAAASTDVSPTISCGQEKHLFQLWGPVVRQIRIYFESGDRVLAIFHKAEHTSKAYG
ncbi:hypothetical protein Vadar_007690 [Vaccinium darrowii]|uniref:Uncharacterized protein n=1 Tax=Vaccinium darrowii TaxID=229202 RepID=A0ACB7ZB58_9ERIC|nr:hypothetical protein Vadar_007690 [Vaccinium darrowii]